MPISYNPRYHLSSNSAFSRHRENLRKDAEWERDIETYKRCLDTLKICERLAETSLTIQKHMQYWIEKKEALEKKYPQLKKIF